MASIWIEMTRDEAHGGSGWEFGTCLWAPVRKENGQKWAYWELLLSVEPGDQILHLRGKEQEAAFVGFSEVESNCFVTERRPPDAGFWEYSKTFYRVNLSNFSSFVKPINLRDLFAKNETEFLAEIEENRKRNPRKLLFFTFQKKRLQCQNGGYFSELNSNLVDLIEKHLRAEVKNLPLNVVNTAEQFVDRAKKRIGQGEFSEKVKSNYFNRCCFPGCDVKDIGFLIGSHIARWSDEEALRGEISNGLCFCRMHDKAFEDGLFTFDGDLRVRAHPSRISGVGWAKKNIIPFEGEKIKASIVKPSISYLSFHWERCGFILSRA